MSKRSSFIVGLSASIFSLILGINVGLMGPHSEVHHWHGVTGLNFVPGTDPGDVVDTAEKEWEKETARRFPDAVIVFSHGLSFTDGSWYCMSEQKDGKPEPVTEVIKHVRAAYPGRVIVLVSCNPAGITLHGFPDVYYFKNSVFMIPDRYNDNAAEERYTDPCPGNIFEAIEAR